MYRLFPLLLIALSLDAQSPASSLDKPPKDVDDALRARIAQFYDFHVARKYRQAEILIAEESKDDYYELSKPDLLGYKIGNIEYSEKFTLAKAVIVGRRTVMLPMMGGKDMDMPFASYWKLIDGKWFWYYNKVASRQTPFGEAHPNTDPNARAASSVPAAPNIDIARIQSALKIDHNALTVTQDKPATAKLTNTLQGSVTVSVDCPFRPMSETGIVATFDKKVLKGDEAAILTLTLAKGAKPGLVPLRISVSPTNQVLDLTVNVAP